MESERSGSRKSVLRIAFQAAGYAVTFLALYFVADRIISNRAALFSFSWTSGFFLFSAAAVIVYAASFFLLADGWKIILCTLGETSHKKSLYHYIYAKTQIAKYIPGNVFQFAGRHAFSVSHGMKNGPLISAMFWEAAGLLSVTGALSLSGLALFFLGRPGESCLLHLCFTGGGYALFAGLLLASFTAPFIANAVVSRMPFFSKYSMHMDRGILPLIKTLFPVYLYYFLFYISAGLILALIAVRFADSFGPADAGLTLTAFALSWILGYITPGSPAGVGIREAVLAAVLSRFLSEADALSAAVLFRIITTAGDVLYFLSSYFFRPKN